MTESLRRFAALPREYRTLLLRALLAVALIRIALLVVPLRRLCGIVCRRPAESRRPLRAPAQAGAWAVAVAARRVPGARCLAQALALQWLLLHCGHGSILRVGVAKGAAKGVAEGAAALHSHAWIEHRGRVVLGDAPDLARYAPILAVRAEAA